MPDLADNYDAWYSERSRSEGDPRELKICDWILDLVRARPGASLLDVACGTGTFLMRARQRGLEVSGVDVSPIAIEVAAARVPDAKLSVGLGEDLPFPERSFEFVTCIGSLEHFPDPRAGAAELRRVLNDSGRAVVYVPNLFFLGHVWLGLRHGTQPSEGQQEFSERFLTSEGWRTLLEGEGLVVESWHPWNHIWATAKVGRVTISAWNVASRVLPKNAAYSFAFVCSRG
jgi:SAM-dependent methyltransferase